MFAYHICDHIWENQLISEKIKYRVRTVIVVRAQTLIENEVHPTRG